MGAETIVTQKVNNRRARDQEDARKYREKQKAKEKAKPVIYMNFSKARNNKKTIQSEDSKYWSKARAVIRNLQKKSKELTTKCNTLARNLRNEPATNQPGSR